MQLTGSVHANFLSIKLNKPTSFVELTSSSRPTKLSTTTDGEVVFSLDEIEKRICSDIIFLNSLIS